MNIARLARWLNQSSSTDANCANLMLFVTENYIHKLGRSMNIAVKHVSTARVPKTKPFGGVSIDELTFIRLNF